MPAYPPVKIYAPDGKDWMVWTSQGGSSASFQLDNKLILPACITFAKELLRQNKTAVSVDEKMLVFRSAYWTCYTTMWARPKQKNE
jgi:hypothetical protein